MNAGRCLDSQQYVGQQCVFSCIERVHNAACDAANITITEQLEIYVIIYCCISV
jgi:hypothetical protein